MPEPLIVPQDYPILGYDPSRSTIIDIDLEEDPMPGMPEHCVICFFRDVFERFAEQGTITLLKTIATDMGDHPVYILSTDGGSVALLHQGMGAPLAVYLMEEVTSLAHASSSLVAARAC